MTQITLAEPLLVIRRNMSFRAWTGQTELCLDRRCGAEGRRGRGSGTAPPPPPSPTPKPQPLLKLRVKTPRPFRATGAPTWTQDSVVYHKSHDDISTKSIRTRLLHQSRKVFGGNRKACIEPRFDFPVPRPVSSPFLSMLSILIALLCLPIKAASAFSQGRTCNEKSTELSGNSWVYLCLGLLWLSLLGISLHSLPPSSATTPQTPKSRMGNYSFRPPAPDLSFVDPSPYHFVAASGAKKTIVEVEVGGRLVPTLIDTGATCSILSLKQAKSTPGIRFEKSSSNALSVSGHPLEIVGRATLLIRLGKTSFKVSFEVVKGSPYPALLGTEALEKFGPFQVDYAPKELTIHGETFPFWMAEQNTQYVAQIDLVTSGFPISVFRKIKIPAWSENVISVSVGEDLAGREVFVDLSDVSPRLVEKGLLIGRSVGKVTPSGALPLNILNTSLKPVFLYPGQVLGKCSQNLPGQEEVFSIMDAPTSSQPPPSRQIEDLDLSSADLSSDEKESLRNLLRKYSHCFAAPDCKNPGQTHVVKHQIDTGDHRPVSQRPRPIPHAYKAAVPKMVEEMVEAGVARRSHSPWSSPIVICKKKSGELRFCVDYRLLNQLQKKDAYSSCLPHLDELLDSLENSQWFSTLDLALGYWQIPVDENDIPKTAFITPGGLHEFLVMPFGLVNAPATFQRTMDLALMGLQWEFCQVFIDDIIVYSKGPSFSEHLSALAIVFERLEKNNLKLKLKKCCFGLTEVPFLGHIVSREGIKPNPEKVKCIAEYPRPVDLKTVRRFLGMAGYYRRFVQAFSIIAAPLYSLTKPTSPFAWTMLCEQSFRKLRLELTQAPILAYPDPSKGYLADMDAADCGLGCVLSQETPDGIRPIAVRQQNLD